MKKIFITLYFICFSLMMLKSETLQWTGKGNGSSFWENANWILTSTSAIPSTSQFNSGNPISYDLFIENADNIGGKSGIGSNALLSKEISININNSSVSFNRIVKSGFRSATAIPVSLNNSYLGIGVLQNMILTLSGSSTVSVYESTLSSAVINSTINIESDECWIGFRNIPSEELSDTNLSFIKIKGQDLQLGVNAISKPYYAGTLILPVGDVDAPVEIYSESDYSGTKASLEVRKIYKDNEIPTGNNKLSSFRLKKGHMMTVAQNSDGTGGSKVFIAAERDIEISELEAGLKNDISFVRVLPWRFTNKKGVGGGGQKLDAVKPGWYYNWGGTSNSTEKIEFVPMSWGRAGANDIAVERYIAKEGITHLLAFNEPDNSTQSNIKNSDAVLLYKNLLRTGLRIGAPSPEENGINNWVPGFMEGCDKNNYRVDFICVHWYDWGNWGSTKNPNPNIDQAVNRFKSYLQNVYQKYKLPIWITEFNVNKNRITAAQDEFLRKMIPILESLDYIERYAYFNPNPVPGQTIGYGEFVINDQITSTGIIYRDEESYSSIAIPALASTGSLFDKVIESQPEPEPESDGNLLINAGFEDVYVNNIPSGWNGGTWNNGKGTANPTPKEGKVYHRFTNLNNGQWAGINQICRLKPQTRYKLSFYTFYAGTATNVTFSANIKSYNDEGSAKNGTINDTESCLLGESPFSIFKPDGSVIDSEWKKSEIEFITKANEWAKIFLSKDGAQWYIDDMRLEEIQDGSNDLLSLQKDNHLLRYDWEKEKLVILEGVRGGVIAFNARGERLFYKEVNSSVTENIDLSPFCKEFCIVCLITNDNRKYTLKIAR